MDMPYTIAIGTFMPDDLCLLSLLGGLDNVSSLSIGQIVKTGLSAHDYSPNMPDIILGNGNQDNSKDAELIAYQRHDPLARELPLLNLH